MITLFFRWIDPLLPYLFRLHDGLCDFMGDHFQMIKTIFLMAAHLTLLGFLFPDMRKDFGEIAANLLIFILFLSPLSRIFRIRFLVLLMGLRRELGIFMAYLATVHGVGYFLDPVWFDLIIKPHWPEALFRIEPMILFGIIGYLLTLPLLFTSNTLANRLLGGKNWKRLHRMVYIVFLLIVLHRLFMRGVDMVGLFQAGFLLGTYGFLKLLAWRNFLLPLTEMITLTKKRYQEWKVSLGRANVQSNKI